MYGDVTYATHRPRDRAGSRMQVSTRGLQSTGGFYDEWLLGEVPVPMDAAGCGFTLGAREAVRDRSRTGPTGSSICYSSISTSPPTQDGILHFYREEWRQS